MQKFVVKLKIIKKRIRNKRIRNFIKEKSMSAIFMAKKFGKSRILPKCFVRHTKYLTLIFSSNLNSKDIKDIYKHIHIHTHMIYVICIKNLKNYSCFVDTYLARCHSVFISMLVLYICRYLD